MIPRFKPDFNIDEITSIINKKPDSVEKFENKFASVVNSKYAVSFPSGRSGLFSIFKALNISDGEVIIPAYTCIVVPPAILASNNIPRFVDVSLTNYNMKLEKVHSAISKKTKATVPTHMYGNPLDIKRLRDAVGDDVCIIEDAAQAMLTKDVGRFSDAVFYSSNFEKQIFTFGGGVITTNNEEIYEKVLGFRNEIFLNESNDLRKFFLLVFTPIIFSNALFRLMCAYWNIDVSLAWKRNNWNIKDENLPVEEAYLSGDLRDKFSDVQASVGMAQLNKIKISIDRRREIAKFYNSKLKNVHNITMCPFNPDSSYAHYTLQVKERNKFELFMRRNGIQVNKVFDYSLPHLAQYVKYVQRGERFDNSFVAGKNNVNLPVYPQLLGKKSKLNHIVNSVIEFDKKFA